MILMSFCLFLGFYSLVGFLSSSFKSKTYSQDYLLANQIINQMSAISAISTSNSGYMFIGQIGFTYTYGLQSIWLSWSNLWGLFIVVICS